MKKLIMTMAAAVGFAVCAGAVSINIGSGTYDFTKVVDRDVASGVHYTYYKCSSRGTYGTHVYITEVDLTNPNVKIEYLTAGGTMGGSTKSLATIAANNTSTNHTVVAGANANFWITSETPWKSQLSLYPHGTAVSNGTMYSVNPSKGTNAHMGGPTTTGSIAFDANNKCYIKRFAHQFDLYNPRIGHTMDLTDCNRVVEAGTASIYTRAYGTSKAFKPVDVSGSSWVIPTGVCTEIICDLASGQTAKAGGDTKYVIKEVRTNAGTGTLGNHDLAIVGRDSYATVLAQHYLVGDEIYIKQHFNSVDGATADIIPTMYNATSGNVVSMVDGVVQTGSMTSYNTTNYARTIYATNDAGTKLWIAVCGNKTSTYYGMTTAQLTYFVKALGATQASEVDCGGSSQMYVDGSQVNQSTDAGNVRNVHSGIFVVSTGSSAVVADPTLTTTAAATNFGDLAVGGSASKSFTVTGANLTGDITMSITGTDATQFVVTPSTILKANQSGTITVKYAPTAAGSHSATLNIATPGVTTKTFALSGKATQTAGASAIYQDDALAYGVTAPSSYTMEVAYADKAISQLSGKTVKRVIARGDIAYILAHDASLNPTIVVFNHTTGTVLRTLGFANCMGGLINVSDIAITGDGKLIGINKAQQAFQGDGGVWFYIWNNAADGYATGDCQHWNVINNSGNYTNAYTGESLCYQGLSTGGKTINTATTTASGGATRFTVGSIGTTGQFTGGVIHNNLNSVSGYKKDDLGDMLLFASPFNENNVILQGNLKAGAEFSLSGSAAGVPTKVADIPTAVPAAANHTSFFRYGGKVYMVSPSISDSNSNGVLLFDVTNGLASASKVTLSTSAMTSVATTNVATVGTGVVTMKDGKFAEAQLALLAVRNGAITKFITPSSLTPDPVEETQLHTNAANTDFGRVKAGETASRTYNVEGENLTADITMTVSGEGFAVAPAKIAKATATGSIEVTFAPTAAKTYNGTLTISTTGADPVTVTLKGVGYEEHVPTGEGAIESLTEVWNYSLGSGNTAPWFSAVSPMTRSIAVSGDKLYVNDASTSAATIHIIDADKGTDTGKTLNMTGVSGGTFPISHIDMLGGHLYGANVGEKTTSPLKVYRWADDNAAPEVVLTYYCPSDSWLRLGENMSVWGDENDGKLMFYFIDNLVVFDVKNGVVNSTPTIIQPAKTLGGMNSTTGVTYNGDGTYTIYSKDNYPTTIDGEGAIVETIPSTAMTGKYGTKGEVFTYGAHRYMAATAYRSTISKGVLDVIDVTDGFGKASLKFTVPTAEDGLGNVSNNQFVTDVATRLSDEGKTITLWVQTTLQGIACYRYSTVTEIPDEPDPVDPWFDGSSDRGHYAYNVSKDMNDDGFTLHYHLTGDVPQVRIHLYERTKARSAERTPARTFDAGAGVKGENTYTIPHTELDKEVYDWEVEVSGYAVENGGRVFHWAPSKLDSRGGVAVVNDPTSPAYGWIITSNGYDQGFAVFNPDHTLRGQYFNGEGNWTASNRSSLYRIALRGDIAYAIDYADAGAGIYIFNPMHPEYGTGNIFKGTKDSGGCWTSANGTVLGGGGPGLCFTGTGADTKLWSYQEDYPSGNYKPNQLCSWNIGTNDLVTTSPTTYEINASKYMANNNVNLVADGNNGLFVSQVRNNEQSTTAVPAFLYIDLNGNILYNAGEHADIIPAGGSGIALNNDRTLLALSMGTLGIRVYDVTWAANGAPQLTVRCDIPDSKNDNMIVPQLAFDPANNICAYQQSTSADKNGLSVYAMPQAMPVYTAVAPAEHNIDATLTGVEDIVAEEETAPVYYNINGVQVPGESLTPGIYLKVTGSKVEKIRVR